MQQFLDDDYGYERWLSAHPDGYVVNGYRPLTAGYLRLHGATCAYISGTPANGVSWTVTSTKLCGSLEDRQIQAAAVGGAASEESTDTACQHQSRAVRQDALVISAQDTARLLEAIEVYDRDTGPLYDEVFLEVHDRIAETGSAGKLDIAALAVWKRSAQNAWVTGLLSLPETHVRATTAAAFAAQDDLGALRALGVLPGYAAQGPLATAILTAYDPNRYAVMDDRALLALERLGISVSRSRGVTLRYLSAVRALVDTLQSRRPGVTPRDVDKGLYVLGVRPRRPTRTRTPSG